VPAVIYWRTRWCSTCVMGPVCPFTDERQATAWPRFKQRSSWSVITGGIAGPTARPALS
jgi:hypothetical protein